MRACFRSPRVLVGSLGLFIAVGCSSGGDGGTDPTGTIALQLNPISATVVQGGQTPVTGTLTRGGGFTGVVTFTVEGAPAGVTATVGNIQNSGTTTTATITILVAATTAIGTTDITVRATGSGVDPKTKIFQLTVTAAPNFTVGVNPSSAIMVQGTNRNDIVVTLTRTNFSDPVTLSLGGPVPAGVTATFAPPAPTGTTSTMTLTVGAASPAGTYNLEIIGTGAPGVRNTPFTLTITVPGSFTLALTPAGGVTLQQGAQDNSKTVNITRTNYTPAVTLSAEGLPNGVTAAFAGSPVAGNSSVMTLTATAGATVGGPVTVTVRGTGPAALRASGGSAALEATTSFQLTITAPSGSGNVTVDFSGCSVAERPVWAASQNGTAAWQVVTPVNNVYSFNVTAGKGGFSYVLASGQNYSEVIVHYMSQAEWTAGTIDFGNIGFGSAEPCGVTPSGRTLTGTLAGMGGNDLAHVSFGGVTQNVVSAQPSFTMNNVGLGTRDLVAYTHPNFVVAASDRMLIDRDENPVSSFGTRNMQSDPSSFLPVAGLITISNPGGGETLYHNMYYYTRSTCDPAVLYYSMPVTGSQFNAYGAQSPMPTDRHGLYIQGSTTSTGEFRSVTEYFNALTPRSVTLGSQVPAGTTTEEGTLYSILRHQYSAPSDLNTSFTWNYTQQGTSRSATVIATYAYFGGTTIDLKIGQYAGLAGWMPSWVPQVGFGADSFSLASGSAGSGGICTGLQRFITAGRFVAGANIR